MADELKPQEQEAPDPDPRPICPYCGKDPARFHARSYRMSNVIALLVFCQDCRKLLPASVLDIEQPRVHSAVSRLGIQ